jgi:hypothetical protein
VKRNSLFAIRDPLVQFKVLPRDLVPGEMLRQFTRATEAQPHV